MLVCREQEQCIVEWGKGYKLTPQKLLGRVDAVFSSVSQVAEVFSAALATSLAAIVLSKVR